MSLRFRRCLRQVFLLAFLASALFGQWVEQGPGPILFGQDEGIPQNPVTGAINGIAISPANGNTIYLATVNGGVWKTTSANSANPAWSQLTDTKLPALSIASIALSPVNPDVIYAGTGSTSSNALDGSPGFGLARSTDGGVTWTVNAAATFTGRRIVSVAPSALAGGNIVLAATLFDRGGLYRSTDAGTSFVRLSGAAGSGLPDGGVSNVLSDPADPNRFYAAVPSNYLNSGTPGIYKSVDGGVTWAPVNTGLSGQTTSLRMLLAIHNSSTANIVYAMFIGNTAPNSGKLIGLFRSTTQGASWTSLSLPAPDIFPGAQGIVHGAITPHPTNPNVVFVAGDRQDLPTRPNANGCSQFSSNVVRGDVSVPTVWANIVCNGAQGTSPHADSRALAFASDGTLWFGNDGGIFRLQDPDNARGSRRWESVNDSLRPTEFNSVAYDVLSRVAIGGAQDTGTPIQSAPGTIQWEEWLGGDGGRVAVDTDQTAHPGISIRYTTAQFLQVFNRSIWDASNNVLDAVLLALRIVSGPGTGQTLAAFDPNIQFYNPYVLNRVDPSRVLIGTASIYESLDRGDTLNNLGLTGKFITSLTYGGRLSGTNYPNVFYVGMRGSAAPFILHRGASSPAIAPLTAYPGTSVLNMAMDPQNYQNLFVLDALGRVWATYDEGATWTNLTANLPLLCQDVRTIEIFSPSTSPVNTVLITGGLAGVFQLRRPGAAGTAWEPISGLPNGLVLDLRYYYETNTLIAGILGRGAWTLSGYFRGGTTVPPLPVSTQTVVPFTPAPFTAPPPQSHGGATNPGSTDEPNQ